MNVIVGTKIIVTREMLEAATATVPLALTHEELTALYKAMRALEPGIADPGVMQGAQRE